MAGWMSKLMNVLTMTAKPEMTHRSAFHRCA